ncbi:MAG: TasA family protein [Clostridia bacterium]
MNQRGMLNSILMSILALFISIGTFAYFSSQKTSADNTFISGTLRMSVGTKESSSTIIPSVKGIPGVEVSQNLTVENTGTLPFQYSVSAEMIDGNQKLFDITEISIRREDDTQICSGISLKDLQEQQVSEVLKANQKEDLLISMVIPPEKVSKDYQDAGITIKLRFDAIQKEE